MTQVVMAISFRENLKTRPEAAMPFFFANYASARHSASRSVGGMSADDRELSGKIRDGDIIFNLKGVYNISSGHFFLSAGSSFLVFEITNL